MFLSSSLVKEKTFGGRKLSQLRICYGGLDTLVIPKDLYHILGLLEQRHRIVANRQIAFEILVFTL